ncbi:NAD(P)-binding domain-containing protein [Peribacillus frigoritolerans]|nr:NAD(P)-binding domain-containing protein [Peribacillus frigoritolerans]
MLNWTVSQSIRITKSKTLFSHWKLQERFFLMVTAGKPIDSVITSLLPHLESGDIIMDGGNSHYEDTERRYDELKSKGFSYVGIGISGGESRGVKKDLQSCQAEIRTPMKKVAPILTKIAAKVNDAPCCTYIGPKRGQVIL